MRLDKFIAENTGLTRSQATKAIRQSAVKINGEIVKNGATKVTQEDEIYFEDELLPWVDEGQYFMLHKPQGYVCSHDDGDYPTIYQFFEPPLSGKLHSAGRLDVDTTGIVLLTDDGQWSHRITSPKHQCEKTLLKIFPPHTLLLHNLKRRLLKQWPVPLLFLPLLKYPSHFFLNYYN